MIILRSQTTGFVEIPRIDDSESIHMSLFLQEIQIIVHFASFSKALYLLKEAK